MPAPLSTEAMTIGVMAQLSGVTVRTLRYYEEMDLIGPIRRTTGKYRLYSPRALKRIKAISAMQELGYSLEDILVALGPYTKTLNFSKQEQVEATRHSLEVLWRCIDEKLMMLNQMKLDVENRLDTLGDVCTPCVGTAPKDGCQEHCSHRVIHID